MAENQSIEQYINSRRQTGATAAVSEQNNQHPGNQVGLIYVADNRLF